MKSNIASLSHHPHLPADLTAWWRSRAVRTRIGHLFAYVGLRIFGLFFAMPFIWLLSTSVKPDTEIFAIPLKWIPSHFIWSNYPRSLGYIDFFLYLRNTLFISLMATLGVLFSCPLVAYSFAYIPWPGRNAVFALLLSTLMLPYQVTMIPVYIVFRNVGRIGTFYPRWVPAFFGNAFSIFLLRQFFMSIPHELHDAARVDGASEFTIFLNVILPLSKPVLSTIALFQFMASWNDFLGPLIYLRDDRKFTLSLGLQQFTSIHGLEWALLMAASVMVTVPIILLFLVAQRFFIEGISMTGIKG